jgi:hypothetical protein
MSPKEAGDRSRTSEGRLPRGLERGVEFATYFLAALEQTGWPFDMNQLTQLVGEMSQLREAYSLQEVAEATGIAPNLFVVGRDTGPVSVVNLVRKCGENDVLPMPLLLPLKVPQGDDVFIPCLGAYKHPDQDEVLVFALRSYERHGLAVSNRPDGVLQLDWALSDGEGTVNNRISAQFQNGSLDIQIAAEAFLPHG